LDLQHVQNIENILLALVLLQFHSAEGFISGQVLSCLSIDWHCLCMWSMLWLWNMRLGMI